MEPKAAIRLVMLDIDGTISGESNQVSPKVKETVKAVQALGVRVGIATGRMYRSAVRFHQEVGSDVPLVSYQGALVKDPNTETIVGHWPVDTAYALRLLEDFAQYGDLFVHLYIDDQLFVQELTPQSVSYAERSQVPIVPVGELTAFLQNQPPPTKLLALSDNTAIISTLLTTLKTRYRSDELYLTRSQPRYFEATHPLANKGTAVKFLAEDVLGLRPEQVLAVGDNGNDLEMIAYAGVGVAMGNSADELKQVADWIAPSIDQDGAAVAMERYVLGFDPEE